MVVKIQRFIIVGGFVVVDSVLVVASIFDYVVALSKTLYSLVSHGDRQTSRHD